MDAFMDRLSDKLNAQEMIRANGQAESEAMAAVRVQVQEYRDCLDRMGAICGELDAVRNKMAAIPDFQADNSENLAAIEDLKQQFEVLRSESEEKFERLNADSREYLERMSSENRESLERLSAENREQLQDLTQLQEKITGTVGSKEDFHKECVRMYRNVQAVLKEETGKMRDGNEERLAVVAKQARSAKIFAVLAFLMGLASVAVPVLIHFGVF